MDGAFDVFDETFEDEISPQLMEAPYCFTIEQILRTRCGIQCLQKRCAYR